MTVIHHLLQQQHNNMHRYISYSQEDLALLKRCAHIKNRSKSKEAKNNSNTKGTHDLQPLLHQLEGTKKISKLVMMEGIFDDNSTKKKQYQRKQVREISEFAIKQQRNEQSVGNSSNLKQEASYSELGEQKINELQTDILGRIDALKKRLQYRLLVNSRQLMRRPAYGKYITQRITSIQQ